MATRLVFAFVITLALLSGILVMASATGPAPITALPTDFGPRDLFNMTELKNLTLDDLHWTEISTRVLPSGVTETIGSWSGGVWETFDVTGAARTITLSERAAIYWPPGYPHTPHSQAGFGHVFAAHEAMALTEHVTVGEQLALAFGLPVLHHGEEAVDWESLGFGGRGDLVSESGPNVMKVNPCGLVDLTRGNFGWALARTNIRAITLLQRLAEQRGGHVTRVALRGGSKEGFATWLASAVDDRIEVDGSGGYQREAPRTAIPAYATDWGCSPPPAVVGRESVTETLILLDWMTRTPAGKAAEQSHSVGLFQHDLYPRFVLINGDVTRFGMHDSHHYALGMETYFLDHLTAVPWRYVRFHDPEQEETKEEILRTLLLEQLVNDSPGYLDQVYPKITSDRVETDETNGRRFRVFATVAPEPEQVRLWWSHSDDRVWNDEENAAWVSVPLSKPVGASEWVSAWVDLQAMGVGNDQEIAYYVEAVNYLHLAPYTAAIPRRDASPVRFLWRLPEVGCPITPPNWCDSYLPLVVAQRCQPWPSATPTSTPSPTPTATSTATPTASPSPTLMPSPTPTASPTGAPYPRLAILSWYTPRDFAARLSELTGGHVTISDTHRTALLDYLAARQLVDVVGTAYLGDSAAADRERLAQAKANAGFLLLGVWGSSGNEPYNLTFTNTGPNSPWPFVPEWFVQEVAAPLRAAVTTVSDKLPIAYEDRNAYCSRQRDTGWENDQVIILDGEKSEAVILNCGAFDRDRSTLLVPLAWNNEQLRPPHSPYDFGAFKSDYAAGTTLRINLWHSWGVWWGYNMTDVGQVGPAGTPYEGLRWNQYRPHIIRQQFKQVRDSQGNLLFDGVNIDTFNQEWFGPYSSDPAVVRRLDLDADGVADYDQQGDVQHNPAGCYPDYYTNQPNWDNCVWATGHTTFTRNLRTLFDNDPDLAAAHNILVQHEYGANAAYINGQSFENLPTLELSSDTNANKWQTAYDHYTYWQTQGRRPSVNFIWGAGWGAGNATDYAQMRLSLAFTLMGNGYFAYVTPSSGNDLLWYDEYAVDSQGRPIDVYTSNPYYPPPDTFPAPPSVNIRTDLLEQGQFAATVRPGLGYLGHPTTDAHTLSTGVYRRDFERGIVLANFSPVTITLSLERPYRKIQGIQDPQTNDGSLVNSITLPAKDAIILLDPAAFGHGVYLSLVVAQWRQPWTAQRRSK